MSEFILHHYEQSPFAEKIRLMMGLTGQRWGSVLSPVYPPRPRVDPLSGGYRRIPIGQLGADLFCDTSIIAAEIAGLTGNDALAPPALGQDAKALAERAETSVFFSAITAVPPARLLAYLVGSVGPLDALRFVKDRMGMMRSATIDPPSGAEARETLNVFIADVDEWLQSRKARNEEPSYADFCIYHPLWLARNVGSGDAIKTHPPLRDWITRMDRLGHGDRVELEGDEAFQVAAEATPRPLPRKRDAHELEGQSVTIAPQDYGTDPVAGFLVSVTAERLILARDTERFGMLHVHFPRSGYHVEPIG